jgi:HAD superfamily hydrolase (TIGR01509 family)
MTSTRTVLFDLGNVLVKIQPEAFSARLGFAHSELHGPSADRVREIVRQYEIGTLSTGQYLEDLHILFGRRFSHDVIRQAMLDIIAEPLEGMDDLVRRVASVATVGLVSNTNELHFLRSLEAVPALRFMREFFLSYELKALKPDPAYYARVLARIPHAAGAIVFIDDLEENVEEARRAGMVGLRFEGLEQLRKQLAPLLGGML